MVLAISHSLPRCQHTDREPSCPPLCRTVSTCEAGSRAVVSDGRHLHLHPRHEVRRQTAGYSEQNAPNRPPAVAILLHPCHLTSRPALAHPFGTICFVSSGHVRRKHGYFWGIISPCHGMPRQTICKGLDCCIDSGGRRIRAHPSCNVFVDWRDMYVSHPSKPPQRP